MGFAIDFREYAAKWHPGNTTIHDCFGTLSSDGVLRFNYIFDIRQLQACV